MKDNKGYVVSKTTTDDIIKEFPDIIETAFDISDDITNINDTIQSELYTAWINSIASEQSLSSTEKVTEWEKIALSYQQERVCCEKLTCNVRDNRTDNVIKLFNKVVLPTLLILVTLESIHTISKQIPMNNR